MKKLFITCFFSLCGLLTFAQGPRDAIHFLPQDANNFLILNFKTFNTVASWKVDIQTRALDARGDAYAYTTVKTLSLSTYYTKMDNSYLDGAHFITIHGLDARGSVVTAQGPVVVNKMNTGPVWTDTCSWTCIGKTYAYGLHLWVHPNGGSYHIQMGDPAPPEDGSPFYYEWVDPVNWTTFTTIGNLSYHGLTSYDVEAGSEVIQMEPAPGAEPFRNAQGNPIYGTAYGVRKYFGPWADDFAMMASNDMSGSGSCEALAFNQAIDYVNDAQEGYDTIHCNGVTVEEGGEAGDPEPWEPCLLTSIESYNEFADCMFSADANFESGVNGNPGGFSWPSGVQSVTLIPFNSPHGSHPIVLKPSTLFDAAGNYIGSPVKMETGLYSIGIQYQGTHYKRVIFDSKVAGTYRLVQKDFLNVIAFPNPIVDNSFSLHFIAQAKVSFTYSLKDERGHEYFSKIYKLEKGQDITDLIDVRSGIPHGFLYNKITFSDGSEINFKTVK